MNRPLPRRLISSVFFLVLSFASSIAAADYRVTAFGDATAFDALIAGDEAAAKELFTSLELSTLDFAEANNLCVTEILIEEFESAKVACLEALDKVKRASDVSPMSVKAAKASIYSNLAVAKALSGDLPGANTDLEAALIYKSTDSNALSNFDLISASLMAMEVAQN